MRRNLLPNYLRIVFTILLMCMSKQSNAQMVLVPDSNFRNALISQGFGTCFTGNYIDSTCTLVRNCPSLNLNNKSLIDLTGIEAFNNITSLQCNNNQLTYLPALPSKLSSLYCNTNFLTTLPALPVDLINLNCVYNNITSLPTFPSNLNSLDCSQNNLTSLPALPFNLNSLNCSMNSIISLPSLPNSLNILYCNDNQITNLPLLPSSLLILDVSRNLNLSFLPTLPSNLNSLACLNINLSSLPNLPNKLEKLYCGHNHLSLLNNLPNNLKILECEYNNLSNLTPLPDSLTFLYCNHNSIISLPPFPIKLNYLSCAFNNLTALPTLPKTIVVLYCDFNNLTYLPELPITMNDLYCNNNPNLSCLPKLYTIHNLDFRFTSVTCLPNYGNVTNSNPLLSSLPLCDIYNTSSCAIHWNVSGKSFYDTDSNCVFSTVDFNQKNFKFKLSNNGNLLQQAYSGGEGYYSFDTDTLGIYKTEIDTIGIPFNVKCPVGFTYTDTLTLADSLKGNRDFSMKCKNGFDLAAWSIYSNAFIPGHLATININAGDFSNLYGAHCASGISGVVTVIINGPVTFVGPAANALSPTSINGDTLIYIVNDFGSINSNTAFNFIVQVDTTALLGATVCFIVSVSPALDNNPTNNFISRCYNVRSSFDPNEKSVYPENNLDINGDRWLTYSISFQNTGNAIADRIVILDTLDSKLDVSTFEILAYSHEPFIQILPGGIVKFSFPEINLPDSSINEPNSHGFVQYRIKATSNLAAGDVIENTANIIFDYNAPVITNTVSNSVINCSSSINTINIILCDGNKYYFNGLELSQSGIYSHKFITSAGCDSTVNLNLQTGLKSDTAFAAEICNGDSYYFGNIFLTQGGIYQNTLINNVGCDSIVTLTLTTKTVNTNVNQIGNTLTASLGNGTYQWINCSSGNIISGATSQTYIPLTSGNYAVIITNGNCTDTSACYYVSFASINELKNNQDFIIYPNPANDFIILEIDNKNLQYQFYISDQIGKRISALSNLKSNSNKISVSNLKSGMYFITLISSYGNKSTKKFVKY